MELVRKFKNNTAEESDIALIESLAETMMDAALCGLGQASPCPLVSAIKFFREDFEKAIELRDEMMKLKKKLEK